MRPSTWRSVLLLVLAAAGAGWLVADMAYGSLVTLPYYAPVLEGVIALFELGLAKVLHDQRRGRSTRRALHPIEVARVAALAKASTSAGALLLGLYGGFFSWTFPRRDRLAAASGDATVAGVSAGASVLLLVAGLVLERTCRARTEDA